MLLFVLSLVVIDVLILGIYTVNEGVSGNLGVKLTPNREMREEIIGVSDSYMCAHRTITFYVCIIANRRDSPEIPLCLRI